MARILVSDSGAGMEFSAGANHYRFIGIEFTRQPGIGIVYGLVVFKNATKIIFDQCWFHGDDDSNGDETKVGVNLGLSYLVAVIDSYFNDFFCIAEIGTCTEAQAIGGGVGAASGDWGGYKIVNNFLEGAGENILFGGGEATGTPGDIEIRRNLLFKPFTWMPGSGSYDGGAPEIVQRSSRLRRFTWLPNSLRFSGGSTTGRHKPVTVKNLLEFKNATRVLIEGNVMENSWGGFTQLGPGIDMNPGTQCAAPQARLTDLTMRYNIMRYTSQPLQIAEISAVGQGITGCPSNLNFVKAFNNISIHDDVFDHMEYSGCSSCGPYLNEIMIDNHQPTGTQLHDVVINHITQVLDNQSGTSGLLINGPNAASGSRMFNFSLKNSILPAGEYGINGGGPPRNDCSYNIASSTPVLTACYAGKSAFGNNMIPWGASNGGTWSSLGGGGPLKLIADQNAVQYVDLSRGDYHLQASSPGHNASDDGTDIGANIDAVNAYTEGVR